MSDKNSIPSRSSSIITGFFDKTGLEIETVLNWNRERLFSDEITLQAICPANIAWSKVKMK